MNSAQIKRFAVHQPKLSVSTVLNKGGSRLSFGFVALLSFATGAANAIVLHALGEIYLSEILALPLAFCLLIFGKERGVVHNRLFSSLIALIVLSLCGYMISDLMAGTQSWQYLKGWGRIAFLLSDCVALSILMGNNRQNLWWFALGMGIGGVVFLAHEHTPLSTWKIGYADSLVFIVLALAPMFKTLGATLFLFAFGVLNMMLDYRIMSAVCIATAAAIWSRSGNSRRSTQLALNKTRIILVSIIAIAAIGVGLSITKSEYSERRMDSNIGRQAGLMVGLRAIAASPIIGYGSWTINEEFAKDIQENEQAAGLEQHGRQAAAPKIFRAHSEILQSWIEGGIFGALFFLVYTFQLSKAAIWISLRRPVDFLSRLMLYLSLIGIWDALASPFGGNQRIHIAMAVAVIVAHGLDRTNRALGANPGAVLPDTAISPERQEIKDGILRRRASFRNNR